MKKGFTLIELLAVIVILAIIALIATPIILGIINDAREESNERSVELYASAVRNAVAAYQLTGTTAPTSFDDLDIQYDGNVVCATEELYEDGSFYIADCTVNGTSVEYTYGEQQITQVYKPQYYYFSWTEVGIGDDKPSDAKENVSEIDTQGSISYLGFDVDSSNKISVIYACFKRNEIEYCLKGYDLTAYETNKTVLEDAFSDVENSCYEEDNANNYYCNSTDLNAYADDRGNLDLSDGTIGCFLWGESEGTFSCNTRG